jgi:hypothetical protein
MNGLSLVSTMTEQEFGEVFVKLAKQLRCHDADLVSILSYYEPLKRYSLATMKASASRLALEPGRKFMPTTGEWADIANLVDREKLQAAIPPPRDEPWKPECMACDDVGSVFHECGGDRGICGRKLPHYAHPYVSECGCRATNRTYQRHHQQARA